MQEEDVSVFPEAGAKSFLFSADDKAYMKYMLVGLAIGVPLGIVVGKKVLKPSDG